MTALALVAPLIVAQRLPIAPIIPSAPPDINDLAARLAAVEAALASIIGDSRFNASRVNDVSDLKELDEEMEGLEERLQEFQYEEDAQSDKSENLAVFAVTVSMLGLLLGLAWLGRCLRQRKEALPGAIPRERPGERPRLLAGRCVGSDSPQVLSSTGEQTPVHGAL